MDNKGLMRCQGRLENSDLTESARCPILLPKNDRFTILVIEEVHAKCQHCGVSQTLSILRRNFGFHMEQLVYGRFYVTVLCVKGMKGIRTKRLPASQVSESTPFSLFGT